MSKKEFKVLFVFPNINAGYSWSPAIQILSAMLTKAGYSTASIHIHEKYGVPNEHDKIIKEIKNIEPKIIAFTATSFEYDLVNELAEHIKQNYIDAFLILGGIQATLQPEMLQNSYFDSFCIGEGERPLLELVNALYEKRDYTRIKSLWIKNNGTIIKNPIDEFITDLNTLPFFDWDILDTKKILKNRNGWLSIAFPRGCPFNCTFCVNQALKKIKGSKGYNRKKSPENAIAELKYLANHYDISVFNFDDDLLILDKQWFLEFTTLYKQEIFDHFKIQYKIEARADTLDSEIVQYLKLSGCKEVQIGVETGDEFLRNNIVKKGIADNQIKNAIKITKDQAIQTLIFVMFGIPHETIKSIHKTVNLIAELKPYLVRPTFYVPIPCTPLYEYCVKYDLLRQDRIIKNHFSEPAIHLTTISDDVLLKHKVLLPWYINKRLGLVKYEKALKHFSEESYEDFLSKFNQIVAQDQSLSKEHEGYEHYSYFEKNMNYLVFHQ